jgi:CheY-like chemotaxis protein
MRDPCFLIVDDDPLNNKLCELVITNRKVANGLAKLISFTEPEKALQYIRDTYAQPGANLTILLLDINMPVINGWQFLEFFEQFDEQVKQYFKIYMLSSSVDNRDIERAQNCSYVMDFISKPLKKEKVQEIIEAVYS